MNFLKFSMLCALISGLAGCYSAVPDPKVSDQDAKYMAMVPTFDVDINFRRYQVKRLIALTQVALHVVS